MKAVCGHVRKSESDVLREALLIELFNKTVQFPLPRHTCNTAAISLRVFY